MIRATKKLTPKCYTVDESSLGTKVGISYIQSITQKVVKAETRDRIYARPFQSLSSVLLSLI